MDIIAAFLANLPAAPAPTFAATILATRPVLTTATAWKDKSATPFGGRGPLELVGAGGTRYLLLRGRPVFGWDVRGADLSPLIR